MTFKCDGFPGNWRAKGRRTELLVSCLAPLVDDLIVLLLIDYPDLVLVSRGENKLLATPKPNTLHLLQ